MTRNEKSTKLTGRIKRYASVSSSMSGLAVKLAGAKYFGIEIDKEKHAIELRETLGNLKGPIVKVAQILSTIPGALPDDYANELSKLQSNVPPMGWLFVKRRMTSGLGMQWETKFSHFQRSATAAASLGQVHKATSKTGRGLAVKVQYPDMTSIIDADLAQLRIVFQLYERFDNAIVTSDIYNELAVRLREELDYEREATNAQLFSLILDKEYGVKIPKIFNDLSTSEIITMTWLEGKKLTQWLDCNPSQEERNQVAINMFRAWYIPFYKYGIIHGDPHLGNYSIDEDLNLNLLDFGSIRIFRPEFVQGVICLYNALKDKNKTLALKAYKLWGFDGLDEPAVEILNLWAEFIYSPLLNDEMRPIQSMRSGSEGRELAKRVHSALKDIGGVRIPQEFVLMDRAAVGLGSVFLHLGAEVNWHNIFHELVDNFSVAQLTKNQKRVCASVGLNGQLY